MSIQLLGALIVAGLAGPLLRVPKRVGIPVAVGNLDRRDIWRQWIAKDPLPRSFAAIVGNCWLCALDVYCGKPH